MKSPQDMGVSDWGPFNFTTLLNKPDFLPTSNKGSRSTHVLWVLKDTWGYSPIRPLLSEYPDFSSVSILT